MTKLKSLVYENLLKRFCEDLERSLTEASVSPSPKLKSFLKQADEYVFKPFGIKPTEQQYFIAGSARLYLYPELVKALKLKDIGDLDMVVPNNQHWSELESYVKKFPNDYATPEEIELRRYTPTQDELLEVFDKWLPKYDEESTGNFEVRDTNTILKNARMLGGYYYMSFYDIIDYKFALKRDKERPIINLLMQYHKSDDNGKQVIKKQLMALLGNDSREADDFLAAGND